MEAAETDEKMINTLEKEFQTKVEELIFECELEGVRMRPFAALRHPVQQARLWRQSRTITEITAQIAKFKNQGAHFLAQCLITAGAQHGRWATNALPGFSWHQWGLAVDCFWSLDGSAVWDAEGRLNGQNGYKVYARKAADLGLVCLGPSIGDWVHVQAHRRAVIGQMTILEIDAAMGARFEEVTS